MCFTQTAVSVLRVVFLFSTYALQYCDTTATQHRSPARGKAGLVLSSRHINGCSVLFMKPDCYSEAVTTALSVTENVITFCLVRPV